MSEGELCLQLINDYRASKGLSRMKWNDSLFNAAFLVATSNEIVGYASHDDFYFSIEKNVLPQVERAKMMGYNSTYVFECVTESSDAEESLELWKASPKHNKAILAKDLLDGAVAFAGGHSVWYGGSLYDIKKDGITFRSDQ